MKFTVQGKNVVIELPEIKEKTKGGIYKPQSAIEAEKEAMNKEQDYVKVLQVGSGCELVKEGDYIFTNAPISAYNMEGEKFGIIHEDFIIGIKK